MGGKPDEGQKNGGDTDTDHLACRQMMDRPFELVEFAEVFGGGFFVGGRCFAYALCDPKRLEGFKKQTGWRRAVIRDEMGGVRVRG